MQCTHCFKTLGVESRMEIYEFLYKNGSATVTELVDLVGLKQPTVSYHLKELKESGLLTSKKHGKEVYYSLSGKCPHHDRECVLNSIKFPAEMEAKL